MNGKVSEKTISVVLASYNGEKYLYQQLQSIWNQSRKPDEIIICDDNSDDLTIPIINEFKDKTDAPIRLFINSKRLGYADNFKKAIYKAEGDYIFLSDQDDVWLKNKIQSCFDILEENQDILSLCSSFELIDSSGKLIRRKHIKRKNRLTQINWKKFLRHPKFPGMAMVIRRDLLQYFENEMPDKIAHDWSLNQVAALKKGLYYTSIPLVLYRQHSDNTVGMLQMQSGQKRKQQRVLLIQELINSLHSIILIETHDIKYIEQMLLFQKRRLSLLECSNFFLLLLYDLTHIYYISMRSILGDIFVFLKL